MRDVSVIITARNEEFLSRTVEGVLKNKRGNTEVIVVCDGNWPDPSVVDHPDLVMIYHAESIGQRAAINEAARLSTAKFIMKLDAHCIVDEGFDVKLMADCEYTWTVVLRMYNLHGFDWVCTSCKFRKYQGPTPKKCEKCAGKMNREMVWEPRWHKRSDFMRFDSDLKFQYWGDLGRRPESQGDIADTMSFVGACFFMHRKRYWELGGSEEEWGSWGQQGTEWACKTWLSGGRVVVNKKTWFSHLFRTQGGDFGFPYPQSGRQVEHARKRSKEFFIEGKWPKAIHTIDWLIAKFAPVPGWEGHKANVAPVVTPDGSKLTKGVVYYTRNTVNPNILLACQKQLQKSFVGPIISVSSKPIAFGNNVILSLGGDYLEMFKKILLGLQTIKTDIVFFCEDDVLYHPSHFEFTPSKQDVYYYDQNVWRVRVKDSHAIHYDTNQLNMLCGYRDFLIRHYTERVRRVEKEGFSLRMGFEPGTHHRRERVDEYKADFWNALYPTLDLRHDKNLTANRWRQDQFRDPRNCRGWRESDTVEGWGPMKDVLRRRGIV